MVSFALKSNFNYHKRMDTSELLGAAALAEPAQKKHEFEEITESQPASTIDRLQQLEVLKEVADVMREDPAVSSMFDVVRQTPDIFTEIQPVLSRDKEFDSAALPGELHRTFTPLFAGISMSRRGSTLLELAIDRHTDCEAEQLWGLIIKGEAYTSELVVGSGVHAAIYNSERMTADPKVPALTIDGGASAGGQFAGPEGPVWFLNTRTRPEDPDAPNVPGGKGSLNTLERGVLQQSDISGSSYASQDTLALPTQVNHLLYSKVLNRTEVVRVEENNSDESGRPGLYKVTLRCGELEEATVTTDRLVFASGLGDPVTGFENSDQDTQDIIEEEKAKFKRGEDAQIMTFEQFAERVGDESDPFPLRPFGWVAVIGPGDGGAVAAEYLLGSGPSTRMSSTQLDQVQEVFWIGQKAETREEYMQSSRQRYRNLGLEFPVDTKSGYAHRLTPIPTRAYKIERTEDGRIKILHGRRETDGTITHVDDVVVDHVVLATGFKKKTEKICSSVLKPDHEGKVDEFVTVDDGWAIARRYSGTQIYIVGPAAELPVSRQDRDTSPAMKRGKVISKTVAVWASAEETAAAARLLSSQKPDGERPASLTTKQTAKVEPVELPPIDLSNNQQGSQMVAEVAKEKIHSLLPHDANSEDITRLAVGTALHRYVFPESLDSIRLTIQRISESENGWRFDVKTNVGFPQSPEYIRLMDDLIGEPLLQSVLVRLTERSVHSSQTAVLDIPLSMRKVSIGEVEIRVKRR